MSKAAVLIATLGVLLGSSAVATETAEGHIAIELNAAEQNGDACRVSFLFHNALDRPIASLVLELVLFDKAGRVLNLLTVNAGVFPRGKSRLRQFDLPNRACDSVGRILLNDVTRCEAGDLTPQQCTAAANVTSRAGIPFSS